MRRLRVAALAAAMGFCAPAAWAQTACPARVNLNNGECGATIAPGAVVRLTIFEPKV
jgi:hypothetical protein